MKQLIIFVSGPGESGKDEFASKLCESLGVPEQPSTSLSFARTVWSKDCADMPGLDNEGEFIRKARNYTTFDEFYAWRRLDRELWRDAIMAYNRSCPSKVRLYEDMIWQGSGRAFVCTGMRVREDVINVSKLGFAFHIWISREGTPEDRSLDFGKEIADTVVDNNGTLLELHQKACLVGSALKNSYY